MGATLSLRNARIPLALLDGPAAGRPDSDGLIDCDIHVRDGCVAAVTPSRSGAETTAGDIDLDGGQVWPSFVDMHTHLDKGHIWPRAANPDGTHAGAVRSVARDRTAHWSAADIRTRFEFGLRCAYAHGTGAIRTHLDSYDAAHARTVWAVFAETAGAWRDRIALQPVYMTQLASYEGAAGDAIGALVASAGGTLGGIVKFDPEGGASAVARLDGALARLFALAARYGLDVDLHVDETLNPAARTLAQVACAVIASGFPGKVTCGHCCSLSAQPPAVAAATIALVREARLSVVCLPMVNLFLQGRAGGGTPRWRGLTLVHELAAAGVPVAVASDNCRDPFFAHGDHDMLEVHREFTRIAHAEDPAWRLAVTRTPADIMRLPGAGRIAIGAPADLVLFRARTPNELLARPQADRTVLRKGVAIDTRAPDYRELDRTLKAGSPLQARTA